MFGPVESQLRNYLDLLADIVSADVWLVVFMYNNQLLNGGSGEVTQVRLPKPCSPSDIDTAEIRRRNHGIRNVRVKVVYVRHHRTFVESWRNARIWLRYLNYSSKNVNFTLP